MMVALGAGAAREIADILQDLAARRDRALALFLVMDDLQPARDPDHHRIIGAADPLAFFAEDAHPVDDDIDRRNLVEQQIVALARRPLDRLLAAGAEPEGRVRLLDRSRLDDDVVVMPPAALIREPTLAGPGAADHVDRLVEPRGRLLLRDAEAGKLIGAVALADAEIEAAVRQ